MSSLKDRRRARRPLTTPRVTEVRLDISDSRGRKKSIVWSGLNLPKFHVEGKTLFAMGLPRRPDKRD